MLFQRRTESSRTLRTQCLREGAVERLGPYLAQILAVGLSACVETPQEVEQLRCASFRLLRASMCTYVPAVPKNCTYAVLFWKDSSALYKKKKRTSDLEKKGLCFASYKLRNALWCSTAPYSDWKYSTDINKTVLPGHVPLKRYTV